MFAPPMRPNSAASQHAINYQQPPQQHSRRRSLSWDAQQGLPPPPSQIDHYDLSNALLNSPRHHPQYQDLDQSSERDTRQLPMNSVSKHPKLKLDLVLTSNTFEAGGKIDGRLEITSATSQRLRLGEIAVELEGVEELTSRDHSATQLFLYNRTLFQGPHLPPSNAVLPAAPVNGYWTARKGRTTFPFSFKLPPSAPSSVQFGGNASLRYSLKATCQTWWSDQKTMVTTRKEAFVVEKWQDEFDEKYNQPLEVVGDTRLFMGGNGQVWLEAGISNSLFFSGGELLIRCGIKNNTKRMVSGMKVSLARRLIFPVSQAGNGVPATRQSLEPVITEIVSTQSFKGSSQYEFGPNEERVTNLNVEIPRDVRTIRKTRLFEIQIVALISLHLGNFAKDLTVELPIYVANTLSTMVPPDGNLESLHPNHPNHPHRHLQHQHHHHQQHQGQLIQRAASAAGNRGPGGFNDHNGQMMMGGAMAEFERYGLDRGWSPAPPQQQQVQFQQQQDFGNLSMPQRPTSAMEMGNSAPVGWTPSTFLASLPTASQLGVGLGARSDQPQNHQQNLGMGLPPQRPGSAMSNHEVMGMGMGMNRSASAAPNLMQQQQQQQQNQHSFNQQMPHHNNGGFSSPVPPQRSVSAAPGAQSQGQGFGFGNMSPMMAQNLGFNQDQNQFNDPQRRATFPDPQQEQRSRLAHMPEPQPIPQQVERSQPPQPRPQSQPQSVQVQSSILPPQVQTQQANPNLHQQQPQSQSPSQSYPISPSSFAPPPPPVPLGLSTIEEDSESQAGTMRSMRGLLAANGASVTRQDVMAFEKMVGGGSEDETPEEKKQRERELMRSMGMKPDDDDDEDEEEEKRKEAERRNRLEAERKRKEEEEEYQKSLPKPPAPSTKGKSKDLDQVETLANMRPRASDIFNQAKNNSNTVKSEAPAANLKSSMSRPTEEKKTNKPFSVQFPDSEPKNQGGNRSVSLGNVESSKSKMNALPSSNSNPTDLKEKESSAKPTTTRIRTDSLNSGGIGLGALENRLSSPAPSSPGLPSLERAESTRTITMANVKPSPISISPSTNPRQRHDSAPSEASALKKAAAAAAEREIRAKREAEEMMIKREREAQEKERKRREEKEMGKKINQSRTPTLAADKPAQVEAVSKNSEASDGERKRVDLNEQRELNKQAVGRVAGWLSTGSGGIETKGSSSTSQPEDSLEKSTIQVPQSNIDLVNSPKTPSPSVMIPNGSSFPFTDDDSATKSNLNLSKSSPPKKEDPDSDRSIDAILRRSSYNSGRYKENPGEIAPTLSADLRALVDSTDGSKARRLGTGLKDHPMNRKLSGSGDPVSFSSDYKRERHTSLPSGPSSNSRGGYPGLIRSPSKAIPTASTFERASSGKSTNVDVPESPKKPEVETEKVAEDPNEEITVPSRVIRALSSNNSTSSGGAIKARSARSTAANDAVVPDSSKPSASGGGLMVSDPGSAAKYDARSARGGKGGRVASVASLWANIADGDSTAAASKAVVSVKPKPRSSNSSKISGEGGAPALDFSQKKLEEKKQQLYKTPNLKSNSAPHFINTTMPKPIFSGKEDAIEKKELATSTSPVKEEVKPSTTTVNSTVNSSRSNTHGSTIPSAARNFSVPSSSTSTAKPPSRYVSQPSVAIPSSTSNSSMKLPASSTSNSVRSISPSRPVSKNLSPSTSSTNGASIQASPSSGSIHEFSAANFRSGSTRRQTVDFLTKPLDEVEKSKLKAAGLDLDKSAAGRGTTKPIGKNKMNELRGMFGA